MRWTIWGMLSALTFVSLLLAAQQLSGGAVRSVSSPAGLAFTLFAAGVASALRFQLGRSALVLTPLEHGAMFLVPSFCLVLLGFVVTSLLTSTPIAVVVWLVILSAEAYTYWQGRKLWLGFFRGRGDGQPRPVIRRETENAASTDNSGILEELPPNATQSILRTQDSDGAEAVSGTLRARFQPGERTVYVHVSFCPPLARVPHIEFEQTDGPGAAIKLAQSLPHGARFDVRLQQASEVAATVELAFHAVASES